MHAREEKLGLLFLQKLELKQTNYQTVLLKCSDFFSSSVADLALKARSLHEHKLKERCLYKDIKYPHEQANQSKQRTNHKKNKRTRRPANPPFFLSELVAFRRLRS